MKRRFFVIAFLFMNMGILCAQNVDSLRKWGLCLKDSAISNNNVSVAREAINVLKTVYKSNADDGETAYAIALIYMRVDFENNANAYEQALKWWKRSANQGCLPANLFLYKKVKSFSRKKAIKYAKKILSANIPSDFCDYRTLAEAATYIGGSEMFEIASKYAAKAADNEEPFAIDYILSQSYLWGDQAINRIVSKKAKFDTGIKLWQRGNNEYGDAEKGLKLFEQSAEAGYPDSQFQMGYIYFTGQVVRPDTLKAVSWFKLASQNKNAKANYTLGRMYALGIGVEQDSINSFRLFMESADEYEESKWQLGLCYHYGFGTVKNQTKARAIFEKFKGKYINADYMIGLTYYAESSPKAISLFQKCIDNKKLLNEQKSDVYKKLSACYRFGRCGVSIDTAKADDLLNRAAKYGNSEIEDFLKWLNTD